MDFYELLITAVEKYPSLYDKQDGYYNNRAHRDRVFGQIAAELNVTVPEAVRTWRNLRERYTREYRTHLTTSPDESGGYIVKSKWPYFKQLSFINKHIIRRPNFPNFWPASECDVKVDVSQWAKVELEEMSKSEEADEERVYWDVASPTTTEISRSLSPLETSIPPGSSSTSIIEPRTKRAKIMGLRKNDNTSSSSEKIVDLLSSVTQKMEHQCPFGAYVSASLSKLPQELQMEGKRKIFDVILELETKAASLVEVTQQCENTTPVKPLD